MDLYPPRFHPRTLEHPSCLDHPASCELLCTTTLSSHPVASGRPLSVGMHSDMRHAASWQQQCMHTACCDDALCCMKSAERSIVYSAGIVKRETETARDEARDATRLCRSGDHSSISLCLVLFRATVTPPTGLILPLAESSSPETSHRHASCELCLRSSHGLEQP